MIVILVAILLGAVVLAWFEGKWVGERNILREWAVELGQESERGERS